MSDDSEGSDTNDLSRDSSVMSEHSMDERKATALSPAHYMSAWRDSLAAQIQQFHESASWGMPNLNLPALPNLPDYQAYPMVRRVSSLFPHRPSTLENLAGLGPASPTAPPAYNELYPNDARRLEDDNMSIKKSSAGQAAAEAMLDRHFHAVESATSSQKSIKKVAAEKQLRSLKDLVRELGRVVTDRSVLFVAVSGPCSKEEARANNHRFPFY